MQTTVKNAISMVGVGLHHGRPVRMRILPASAEYGIWFRRTDIGDRDNLIAARYDNVTDTTLCTRIENAAGVSVSTVEHLMAALAGCGIHNALIELNAPEVPIMDGSSERFAREILAVGIRHLSAPVRVIRVLKPVHLQLDDVSVSIEPADHLEIGFRIDFPGTAIGQQAKVLDMSNGAFLRELCDSRTFCRKSDVEFMRAQGLGRGGNLANAIVVDGDEILTPGGMRHDDECVRHKMLDALGDLMLAGAPILGSYHADRGGHRATNQLLRKLFATPSAFEMITCLDDTATRLPGAGVKWSDLGRVA